MSSSSYTSNLSLSQFESLDKPSWLQDYNSDMEKIDGACQNFTGTDGSSAGTAGFVPAPATTDADKFLKSDGTWASAGGGSTITLYETTGQNTDGAMTQKATTDMVFKGGVSSKVNIGGASGSQGSNTIAIGSNSTTLGQYSVAIGGSSSDGNNQASTCVGYNAKVSGSSHSYSVSLGANTNCEYSYSVSLGAYSHPRAQGVVDVKALNGTSKYGYQGTGDAQRTEYRVISGVHAGEDDHDVAIVGQVIKCVRSTSQPTNNTAGEVGTFWVYSFSPQSNVTQCYIYICTTADLNQNYYEWRQLF